MTRIIGHAVTHGHAQMEWIPLSGQLQHLSLFHLWRRGWVHCFQAHLGFSCSHHPGMVKHYICSLLSFGHMKYGKIYHRFQYILLLKQHSAWETEHCFNSLVTDRSWNFILFKCLHHYFVQMNDMRFSMLFIIYL